MNDMVREEENRHKSLKRPREEEMNRQREKKKLRMQRKQ